MARTARTYGEVVAINALGALAVRVPDVIVGLNIPEPIEIDELSEETDFDVDLDMMDEQEVTGEIYANDSNIVGMETAWEDWPLRVYFTEVIHPNDYRNMCNICFDTPNGTTSISVPAVITTLELNDYLDSVTYREMREQGVRPRLDHYLSTRWFLPTNVE